MIFTSLAGEAEFLAREKACAEGDTPEALGRIQALFRRAILAVAPDARLPF